MEAVFFSPKSLSVVYKPEVNHLQAMLKFMNIFTLLSIARRKFFFFFLGGGSGLKCGLKCCTDVFDIEIYCCSCQHSLSVERKGMWIVGRLEVRGRWEPGKDCFLLYPVPRWSQIAVFLWQSLTSSDTAKWTGWCLHIAVTTSLSLTPAPCP